MVGVFILVPNSHWYHLGVQSKVCLVHNVVNEPGIIIEVQPDKVFWLVVPFSFDMGRDEIRTMRRGFPEKV
jgi:hypothetical protein